MSAEVRRGVRRWALREAMGVLSLALLLFVAAGTARWIAGWVAVAIMAAWVIATAAVVIPRHPDLLAERVGPRQGSKRWDTALLGTYGLAMTAMWIVGGLDVRWGWSPEVGAAARIAGGLAMIVGHALVVWATAANAFFSQVVRIQTERGHRVVEGGPYRFVRHPAYVGSLLVDLGAPLLLGSWWALIPGGLCAALMIVRTALEDRTLRAELAGYLEYTTRTRSRLLPGVW